MIDEIALVASIDRNNGTAKVALQDGSLVDAAADARTMPLPLTYCLLRTSPGGLMRVVGQLGDRRLALHDDFMGHIPLAAGTAAPATFRSETSWTLSRRAGVGTPTWTAASDSTAIGAVTFTPASVAGIWFDDTAHLRKGYFSTWVVDPMGVYGWFRWKCSEMENDFADRWCGFGQGENDTTSTTNAAVVRGSASFATFQAGSASGLGQILLPTDPFRNSVWVEIEIMVTSGWSACWVNGDGPYVVPYAPPGYMTPEFGTYNQSLGNSAPPFSVDFAHVESVGLVARQTDLDKLLINAQDAT